MEKFKEAVRSGEEIELKCEDEGILRTERIFGAICPASENSPFYALCLGQIPHSNKAGRKKLFFLGEVEAELPEAFFKRLAELSRRFLCWKWFYNRDAGHDAVESLSQLLRNHTKARDLPLRLLEGETLNWSMGLLAMQQWAADDALDIPPDSILSGQLARMTIDDRNERARSSFYAVDCLRAALSVAAAVRIVRPASSPVSNTFYYG